MARMNNRDNRMPGENGQYGDNRQMNRNMPQNPQRPKQPDRAKQSRPGKKKHGLSWFIGELVGLGLLIVFFLAGVTVTKKVVLPIYRMYQSAEKTVADSSEDTFKSGEPSILYDVDNNEVKKIKGDKETKYLTYDELPDAAKLAIISIEDKNFTTHKGIDVQGILRSLIALIKNRGQITMGGSTITQQLSRNIFLNFDETYGRKIKEIFISIALEQKYTKEQILEFYLNNVYFANGYYGIEAASQAYFHKSCKDISIAQTAYLCAIPNSPSSYDPYKHANATMKRQRKILDNMYSDGYITKDQYEKSCAEDIKVYEQQETTTNDYAQTYMMKCAVEALMETQGFTFKSQFKSDKEKEKYDEEYDELYSSCRQSLYNNGYEIHTSIDMDMQEKLQSSISTELGGYFVDKTDDGIYRVQGAAVCIDNSNGKVAAIVGGREQDQEGYGLNRAYQSFRQPGSAIKPVLVYAPAFEAGYTPDSEVDDSEMDSSEKEKVTNADGYDGRISIRSAVKKSSNVATYRLYQSLGSSKCMKYLEKMNFKGLDSKDYKYDTTCLGGFTTGVTPLEMAASYATLANDGTYRKPTCILSIVDSDGNEIVSSESSKKTIYTKNASRMMTSVLESCVNDGGTASVCELDNDMPAACKTGTTTNCVDGWLCGYTPYYTTAVWVGKDVYEEVENLKGNTYPAEIWKAFMNEIHTGISRDTALEAEFGQYTDGDADGYEQYTTSTTESQDDEDENRQEDAADDSEYDQDDQDAGDEDNDYSDDEDNNGDNADEESDGDEDIQDDDQGDDDSGDSGDDMNFDGNAYDDYE